MAGDKGIGERVARAEDERFLRGRSSFTDDLVAEGEVCCTNPHLVQQHPA